MTNATINIKRDSCYGDKLRNYLVEVDGVIIGEIGDGQSKTFNVKPGTHTLCLKIDWCRSRKLQFKSSANKVTHFRCSSRGKGAGILLGVFYIFILFNDYIKLEHISQA